MTDSVRVTTEEDHAKVINTNINVANDIRKELNIHENQLLENTKMGRTKNDKTLQNTNKHSNQISMDSSVI